MQPSLIQAKDKRQKKLDSWMNGIDKTGYMRTSAIPDVSLISKQEENPHIVIEAIDFNQHISPDILKSVVNSSRFKLDDTITILDFGLQKVDCNLLSTVFDWLELHQVSIKQLNLATLANCQQAWKYLVNWIQKTSCQIQSLDLGKMTMTLDKVKDIAKLFKDPTISINRLDFGSSHWSFQEMKVFLWSGALSKNSSLTRLALGDAHFCAHSLRLLVKYVFQDTSPVQVFSSGVVELSEEDMNTCLAYLRTDKAELQSLVLSHQSFEQSISSSLGELISKPGPLRHLALINCWFDQTALANAIQQAAIENIHLETITAGQIQQLTAMFLEKGYQVGKEISRHQIRLKRGK